MLLSPRFNKAFQLASELHARQVRKGSLTPYIAHLMAVAGMVLEHGGDEDAAIGALLHDAVEDQGGTATLERIRREFGDTVAGIVEACSDTRGGFHPLWRQRKQRFLESLPRASAAVRLIMTADKLHNVRTILRDLSEQGDLVWHKFRGGKSGTLWYYRTALETLRQTDSGPLLDELEQSVNELERLAGRIPGEA